MMDWDEQIACRTLWAECRGEPEEGQRAVAHVLLNRLKDGRAFFGKTLAGICLRPFQFSCWNHNDPQRDRMALLTEQQLAPQLHILNLARVQADPTKGALYYYSDSMATPPSWAAKMTFIVKIGRHNFLTDTR